jgi:hypothetical protein
MENDKFVDNELTLIIDWIDEHRRDLEMEFLTENQAWNDFCFERAVEKLTEDGVLK